MPRFIDETEVPSQNAVCEIWADREKENTQQLPECPRCNKDIKLLLTRRTTEVSGKVAYNYLTECFENVIPEEVCDDELYVEDIVVFVCPHCKNPIFDDIESANNFFYDLEED